MDKKERGPFYCDICDCELKDSANYLDHINGKKHNKAQGLNLNHFKDSTLEEVEAMLAKKRMERDAKLNKSNKFAGLINDIPGQRSEEESENEEE